MQMHHEAAEHAAVSGSPGEGARSLGLVRVFSPILILLLCIGLVIGMALPLRLEPMIAGCAVLLLLVGLGFLFAWSDRRLRNFLKGAEGEEQVARMLGYLPSDFFVFHSLWLSRNGGGAAEDVDHVVVGPTGVFVVETKNWAGEISVVKDHVVVNGRPPHRDPLQQVYRAARQVRDHIHEQAGLEVQVHPVLCFAGSMITTGGAEASGVRICNDGELVALLQAEAEPLFLPEKVERVVNLLQKRSLV